LAEVPTRHIVEPAGWSGVVNCAEVKLEQAMKIPPLTGTAISAELIARSAGIKLIHVPYKGAGPVLTGLLGGQVDL
jgi:hypothetical protein